MAGLVKWKAVMPANPQYIPSWVSRESLTWALLMITPSSVSGRSWARILAYQWDRGCTWPPMATCEREMMRTSAEQETQ
jgi:hypothetical protein